MTDQVKAWYASSTIWGGIAAILAGLANLAMIIAGQASPDTVIPSLMSLWGGVQAIWGRTQASAGIDAKLLP